MKKVFIALSFVFVIALVSACSCAGPNPFVPVPSEAVATASALPSSSMAPLASDFASVSPSTSVSPQKIEYKNEETITYKYYDVAQEKTITGEYQIPDAPDEKSALDAINQMLVKGILGQNSIEVNSIKMAGGNITVDFSDSIANLNLGSSGEVAVLDSIADTYLDNVDGAKAIYYTINGEPYASGHIQLYPGEAYKTK